MAKQKFKVILKDKTELTPKDGNVIVTISHTGIVQTGHLTVRDFLSHLKNANYIGCSCEQDISALTAGYPVSSVFGIVQFNEEEEA
ncbi:MAG: hypothetical protein V4506_14495 [Bacteroidota bacterium]